MTENERLLIQLQDCFTAGYTMPQFCIDNNIKKPLIVAPDENYKNFLWEIYIQFKYDKRLSANFGLLKGNVKEINFSVTLNSVPPLTLKNVSEINDEEFDKIIILTAVGNPHSKIIYLQQLTDYFMKRAYSDIPLLHFIERNPKVKLITFKNPYLIENDCNTALEKNILNENKKPPAVRIADGVEVHTPRDSVTYLRDKIFVAKSKGETVATAYDVLGYSNEKVYALLETPEQKVNIDGSISLCDNEFLKIQNGHRVTANQPEKFQNTIYFVGNCITFGYGVPFDKTLESQLQNLLNENKLSYKVENFALFSVRRRQDAFYFLDKISPKRGDIIFINGPQFPNIPHLNLGDILKRPHNYGEVFPDRFHFNENGHKAVADYIFKVLVGNNFFKDIDFNYPLPPPPPVHRYGIPKENFISPTNFSQNKELEEYKSKLREKRFQVGAIVMNCNPFTLGHEYLIEYASKKVKKLYIFVVEEDKSEFKFADRFELVKRGVKKFSNVEVLPSGKFIISQQTFSGYFNKENLQDVAVDSSEDVEIFAREIAPSLGITVRFVGEEPEDSVTRQYNENMRRILPQYNIDFCEIPRREINGEVISAKKVREALKVGDFDTIKKLVPKTTLKFLRENF